LILDCECKNKLLLIVGLTNKEIAKIMQKTQNYFLLLYRSEAGAPIFGVARLGWLCVF